MKLESLLKLNRIIRVIGFDDAPFIRGAGGSVSIAGVVCAGTRFEGLRPAEAGFVCVDAVYNRPFRVKLTPMGIALPLPSVAFFFQIGIT